MNDQDLIALAAQETGKPSTAIRSKRSNLLPIINALPVGWPLTAKIDWLIARGRVAPGERLKAYSALFRLLQRQNKNVV